MSYVIPGESKSIVKLVERCARNFASVNKQNRFLIDVDRRMTPAERRVVIERWWWFATPGLSRLLRTDFVSHFGRLRSGESDVSFDTVANFGRWVRRLAVHESLGKPGKGFAYVRALTTRGYCLYRNRRIQNDHLLVGFPGRSDRLMMPVADFLQGLEPLGRDLLLLWTDFPRFEGNDGSTHPQSFVDSVEALRAFAESQGYRHISVVGTSGGSATALYCGAAIKADSTVIVGALDPDRPHSQVSWPDISDIWASRLSKSGSNHTSGLSLTYGSNSVGDREVTAAIAGTIPALEIEVRGAGHSPLWDLVLRREFALWLRKVLVESSASGQSVSHQAGRF